MNFLYVGKEKWRIQTFLRNSPKLEKHYEIIQGLLNKRLIICVEKFLNACVRQETEKTTNQTDRYTVSTHVMLC